jgi:hypothetical protein
MKNVNLLLLWQYIIIFSKMMERAITLKNKLIERASGMACSGGISGTGGKKSQSNHPLRSIA